MILLSLDRILEHMFQHQGSDAPSRLDDIIRAIDVLESNPLIGRPASGDLRELVIGRRARGYVAFLAGYVALYRYVPEIDTVFVLAIRGQKEAGYTRT